LIYTPEHGALQEATWFQNVLAAGHVVLRSNSTVALLAAARASVGLAVLPRLVANVYPDLVAVSPDLHASEFWLVTHPAFRRDPKVRATVDFLKREASADSGRGFERGTHPTRGRAAATRRKRNR
jgi:DNA-binding transcriptional LysR family regulator